MEKELLDAAQEGSVETLLKLLQEDGLILRRYISGGFKETPLHVAAMFGHWEFAKEVLSRMPEMAKELDYRKSTPLHVAVANGHILVVRELLFVNSEVCYAKDWEGRNPIHIAVIKGHIEILKELVWFRPHAAQDLLGASTVLHLCVKHYQEEALKFILEVFSNDAKFVNFQDEEGFTILHLAVAEKQAKVVKLLLQHHQVEANTRNKYGFTALDINLAQGRRNIKDIEVAECFQQAAGELGGKSSTTKPRSRSEDILCKDPSADVVESESESETGQTKFSFWGSMARPSGSYDRHCNTLMLVASIIATVTFQAIVNPPSKIDDEDYKSQNEKFILFNTLGFSASIGIILLLISGFPLKRRFLIWILRIIMWVVVISAAATYYFAMSIVQRLIPKPRPPKFPQPPGASPRPEMNASRSSYPFVLVLVWLSIIILALGIAIRILLKLKMVRRFLRWMRKKVGRANSNTQVHSGV